MNEPRIPTSEQRQQFESSGFVIVRGALDPALVSSLVTAVDLILDRALAGDFGDGFRWFDRDQRVPDFISDLLTPAKYDPCFGELFDSMALPFAEGLLRGPVRCSWLMLLTGGAGNSYSLPLHRDNNAVGGSDEMELIDRFRSKQSYFQAPLLPGDRFLQVIPGSHERLPTEAELAATECGWSGEELPGLTTVELEPGDAIFRHGNLLHRGWNPDGQARWTLVSSQWSADIPLLDIEKQDAAGIDHPGFVESLPARTRLSVERYLSALAHTSR